MDQHYLIFFAPTLVDPPASPPLRGLRTMKSNVVIVTLACIAWEITSTDFYSTDADLKILVKRV